MPLSIISGLSGVIKINFKKYAIATFLGVIPRNLILALSGFFLGEIYITIAKKIDHAETIMSVILIILILAYILGHKLGFFKKLRNKIL